jgi:hypothetical protein
LLPAACSRFITDNETPFLSAPGSGHNHQHFAGGYADHVDEVFALAATLHLTLSQLRPLPFKLEDALLVLFLHDVEKIWKRLPANTSVNAVYAGLARAYGQHALQELIIADYSLILSSEQENALTYIHGEGEDYSGSERIAGELAAFCHTCDFLSARLWYDQPQRSGYLPLLIS